MLIIIHISIYRIENLCPTTQEICYNNNLDKAIRNFRGRQILQLATERSAPNEINSLTNYTITSAFS